MPEIITPEFARSINASLQTSRLSLEPLVAAHADLLHPALRDPRIYRWIDAGAPADLAELRSKWRRNETRLSPDQREAWLNWAIRLAPAGAYIGKLDATLSSPTHVSNLGFVFFPAYWGHGYATESVTAVITALAARGVLTLRATVAAPNTASARVLEKVGFIRGELVQDEANTYSYTFTLTPTAP